MKTISDILIERSKNQPSQLAYVFLEHKEHNSRISLTYAELEEKAKEIAVKLQNITNPGDSALLLYPPGLEYIVAFFGCLFAGIVAVPAYPPRPNRSSERIQKIIANAGVKIALTTISAKANIDRCCKYIPELGNLELIFSDSGSQENFSRWKKPELNGDSLAFLQYTSGSTGTPKAVTISHNNIISNSEAICTKFQHNKKTIFVGWLPLFHDMGLIGNLLQPMYLGIPSIMMSPVSFLQKPIRWLQAISFYRATTSGGPNFAYDLCIEKITPEQKASLDLSSWEIAFNGAEPVKASTIERFSNHFANVGFRKKTFYPCYGMAESTLIITGGNKEDLPVIKKFQSSKIAKNKAVIAKDDSNDTTTLVGCGQSVAGQSIAIVNPDNLTALSDNEIGEIWVTSNSVSKGYWQQEDKTNSVFNAYLADTNEGPFLRTGDLGFLGENKELFITGRIKDLIIICGRNYYPQDIEFTVQSSHFSLQHSCGAVFTVEIEKHDKLIVVQEIKRTYLKRLNVKEVIKNILRDVALQHGLDVYDVVLIKPVSLPKTSSGKIKRHLCRTYYLKNHFEKIN